MSTSPRKRPASEALVAGGWSSSSLASRSSAGRPASAAGICAVPADGGHASRAEEISDLYDIVFAIAVVIFFAVEGLIVWSILRYRRKPGDTELPPQTHGNNLVEIIWTLIPTVIVLYLFVDLVADAEQRRRHRARQARTSRSAPSPASSSGSSSTSTRTASQVATQTIPLGRGRRRHGRPGRQERSTSPSTARDVIHAFYVPRFLFKRDVVPGPARTIRVHGRPRTDAGQTFRGQCAELCGIGHRDDALRRPRA